jgi:hypothetical protein
VFACTHMPKASLRHAVRQAAVEFVISNVHAAAAVSMIPDQQKAVLLLLLLQSSARHAPGACD